MNRVVEEMIRKAKNTSITNRGNYPVTAATNVFKTDGTPLEEKTSVSKPDVIIDPSDSSSTSSVNTILTEAKEDSVIGITEGEINEEISIDKGVTLQGVNSGIPQNFDQEV